MKTAVAFLSCWQDVQSVMVLFRNEQELWLSEMPDNFAFIRITPSFHEILRYPMIYFNMIKIHIEDFMSIERFG